MYLTKRKYIICCSIIIFCASFNAQNCDLFIKGRIIDEDNREELGFAIVKLKPFGTTIQCNERGEFNFSGLCSGSYELLVHHAGCRDTVYKVNLNKSEKMVFKLPHSFNALNAVEVIGKHKEEKPMQSVQILEAKALDKTRGQSLGDQLKQMNGITTFNTGATISKPMINGMQGYRILILNNGIRQEGQQWGNEHAPEIDPFVAQKLSVVRGASSVRYGSDAIGGVILVEPADMPDTASVTGEANLVGYTNGRGGVAALQLQGYSESIKYFSWRVQGSAKRSGNLKTPTYFLRNTGLDERNFSATIAYHRKRVGASAYFSQFNNRVGIFSGAHIGNLTDLQAAFNQQKPTDSLAGFSYMIGRPFQNIKHNLLKLSADFHTGLRSRVYLNYAYQDNMRQEFDKHVPRNDERAALNLPELDYRISTQTAELIWEHNYIKSFRGKFGTQGLYQQNIYYGRFFIPNFLNQSLGVFGIERFVRRVYEVEAGIRYDYRDLQSYYYVGNNLLSPQRTFSKVSYNLGGLYKPDSSINLSLNLANGWRAPAVNEMYSNGLHHGVGAIERGDNKLQTETCMNVTGALRLSKKQFSAEITAYTYEFKNYIYYEPAPQAELTIRGAYPVFNYRQNDANISGADALFHLKAGSIMIIKTRAMWVRGWNRGLKQHLVYMPADRYEAAISFNIKNNKRFKDCYLEPNFNYVGKQTRLPIALDFAPAPEAYFLFGLNAGATIKIGKQDFIFTISVNNAANRVYRDYLDRFRYFNDAPGTNYTLRLRIPFTIYDKKHI